MYELGRMLGAGGMGRKSTGHWMYSKDQQKDLAGDRQLGRKRKAGVCESVSCLGEMQLL